MATAHLLTALQNKALYDHPVSHFKLLETHISWVLLTGPFAYKIKKPVDLQFLDYSTLEKRQYFCQLEETLNKMLAPSLYLGVVPIYGTETTPTFKNSGPVLEYALKMREFSQEKLCDHLLAQGELSPEMVANIAKQLAEFHNKTSKEIPNDFLGTPLQVYEPVAQNFEQIAPLLTSTQDINQLQALQAWSESQFAALKDTLQQRRDLGFIRECHGDIHLGNIVLVNGEPLIFDRIEFSDALRFTDTMADVGFMTMDLFEKQAPTLANHFLNSYLNETGDYQGVRVLTFYQVYRAIVRAKIALMQCAFEPHLDAAQQQNLRAKYQRCMALATNLTHPTKPILILMHGYSGSGKSTIAEKITDGLSAIHLRSDLERKRLSGLNALDKTASPLWGGLYSAEKTQALTEHLQQTTRLLLQANWPVIIDATFLQADLRQLYAKLAQKLGAEMFIIDCVADDASIRTWLQTRQQTSEISEAGIEVYEAQQKINEPLTTAEQAQTLLIKTEQWFAHPQNAKEITAQIVAQIKARFA